MENITTMRRMPACALLPTVAYRNRAGNAPTSAVQGSALSPISTDVSALDAVFGVKGFGTPAGIRSWSPPV